MPISGSVVHQQLMDAYQQFQNDLQSWRDELQQSHADRDSLADDRGETLAKLAPFYLPELTDEAVASCWAELRLPVGRVLAKKLNQTRVLSSTLNTDRDLHRAKEAELIAVNGELDAAVQGRDEVALVAERRLRDDPEFVKLSDRAALAEAALERAEANLDQIEQDAAKKLPAYEQSDLFTYLRDRGFGTDAYTRRGFTRRMDRWVAKMVGYRKAKQSYDFLRRTPDQMRRIIADDRAAFDTVMGELERRRDAVAAEFDLTAKIAIVDDLTARRDQLLIEIEDLIAKIDADHDELARVEDPRGSYYQEAVELFRDALMRMRTSELLDRADRTVNITDDQIVSEVVGIDDRIASIESSARERRDEINARTRMSGTLGKLIQRFRAAGFDSQRSTFVDSLDIAGQVALARDNRDVEALWQQIRTAQRWGPTAVEQFTDMAKHPLTQIMVSAMTHAAGNDREAQARRAGDRRYRRSGSSRGGR